MILSDFIMLKALQDSPLQNNKFFKEDEIDKLWNQAVLENKSLYNGDLLSFVGIERDESSITIYGTYVEYKQYWVQTRYPNLNLGIIPIAVSGIILFEEQGEIYTIMARRRENVTQYANFLEFVPSGSIDKLFLDPDGTIDFKAQLKKEFTEETYLSDNVIKDIQTFAFVNDKGTSVYDICSKIYINCTSKDIKLSMEKSLEYYQPEIIKIGELKQYAKENKNLIVLSSLRIIDNYC
ncbi:MAG: hypothetical protein HQK93_09565 [Nitrospirae bacterium]|nr:hypothetical protein [Nitrospirota bacterium]